MTALVKYHDKLIVELSGEEMSIVKDALDRARKESGLRDRKSLLLFIVKSFLDGTATSGRETRKSPYQILLHHIEPEGAGGATEEKNLCTACAFCHDLVHEGKLSVGGEAPHKLIWRDERGQIL
ncbi:MAG: HNH endonuclease [Vulcanimicrobiota bacterium]